MPEPKISYSQCWEDTKVVLQGLEISSSDVVLSIGSGGDNSLAIMSHNPKHIDVVDSNKYQNYLTELKLKSIILLDYSQILHFLGYRKSTLKRIIPDHIIRNLSDEAKYFWNSNQKAISNGVVHVGKFEKYLSAFRCWILPLTHTKKERNELLRQKSSDEQKIFFETVWNNKRWNILFDFFFSKNVLKKWGRKKEMFDQDISGSVASNYKEKTKQALLKSTLFNNSYLQYIFLDKYTTTLPDYMQKSCVQEIKKAKTDLHIHTGNILEFLKSKPDNFYSKFNLSDIFEPLDLKITNDIFTEVLRVAQPNALLIFWNNLVDRDIPSNLMIYFQSREESIKHLKSIDRIFFYNCFKIYQIKK